MNLERARFNMIEQQIRPWQVLDQDVLRLLGEVKREDFVPVAHKALAFADLELPLINNSEAALQSGQCMLNAPEPISVDDWAQIMADKFPRHFANILNENDDAETGDVFLQCCLWGDIVYG